MFFRILRPNAIRAYDIATFEEKVEFQIWQQSNSYRQELQTTNASIWTRHFSELKSSIEVLVSFNSVQIEICFEDRCMSNIEIDSGEMSYIDDMTPVFTGNISSKVPCKYF